MIVGFSRKFTTADPLYLVLVTGQSNANGNSGPLLSTATPVYTPVPQMFVGGIRPGAAGTGVTDSLVPLVESNGEETVCSGMARRLHDICPGKQFVFAISAADGTKYSDLKKGTTTYARLIDYANALKTIATGLGRTVKVAGVLSLHGEQDTQALTPTATYTADCIEWQSDLNTDLKAVTSQSENNGLYMCQQIVYGPIDYPLYRTAQALYEAWKSDNSKVVLIGSRYMYTGQDSDGSAIHFSGWSKRWHGMRYAEAVNERFFNSANWKPLSPVSGSITRSGATITLPLNVWHTPVQLKYDYVGRQPNHGFTFTDDSGSPPTVTGVTVANSTTLTITLSGTPTGTGGSMKLRYAYGGGSVSPFYQNQRGNVCDSSGNVSPIDGLPLDNWLVSFEEAVS